MSRLISDDTWGIVTVWQESRGEPFDGKVAVAEVIQRRARERYSSDGTVAGTVLRSKQFSGWRDGDPNRILSAIIDDADAVVQECIKAWITAKAGSNVSGGALLYYAPALTFPAWAPSCRETAVIGHHRFMVPLAR